MISFKFCSNEFSFFKENEKNLDFFLPSWWGSNSCGLHYLNRHTGHFYHQNLVLIYKWHMKINNSQAEKIFPYLHGVYCTKPCFTISNPLEILWDGVTQSILDIHHAFVMWSYTRNLHNMHNSTTQWLNSICCSQSLFQWRLSIIAPSWSWQQTRIFLLLSGSHGPHEGLPYS